MLSQKDALESISIEAEEMILHNQTFRNQWSFFDPYPAQGLLEAGERSSIGRWRNLVMLLLIIYIFCQYPTGEQQSHLSDPFFLAQGDCTDTEEESNSCLDRSRGYYPLLCYTGDGQTPGNHTCKCCGVKPPNNEGLRL